MVRDTNINFRDPYEEIGFATGKKKKGKSYAVNKLIKKVKRLIVWDYNWEHHDKIIVHTLSELDAVWKNPFIKTKRIVFQPVRKRAEDFEAFLKQVNTYVYVCLVIEELRIYTIKNKAPDVLFDILDSGRHRKIGIWVTSRRSKGMIQDVPYNADHILAFIQYKEADIQALSEYMDEDKIREVQNKPLYWFAYYNDETGETVLHAPL